MKILFVADLHYSLKQFDWLVAQAPRYEFVIIGGDLLDLGSDLDFDIQIAVVEKYLERLHGKTRLLVSSGNHDGDSRNAADESFAQWLREKSADGFLVDGQSLDRPEVFITICPWWDGPVTRAELEAQLQRDAARGRSPWLWVHHAPPSDSPVCWSGRKFAGDEYLREWIVRYQPDAVLCGHIHNSPFHPEGSWIDRIGKSWVFNPGRQIGAYPTHIAIDLVTMTAEWISSDERSTRLLAVVDR
jgi:Icc-related predicted phosphoesterase